MVHRFRFLAVLLLSGSPALAQTSATLNEQFAKTRAVEEIALSPDGQSVASAITDPTALGGHTHLWALLSSGNPKQLTGLGTDIGSEDGSPAWSPDGRQILYLKRSSEAATVKRIDLGSGKTETLSLFRLATNLDGGWDLETAGRQMVAKGFAVAPSGAIAVWASDASDASQHASQKDDQHLYGQRVPIHLYIIADGKKPREIMLPEDIRNVAWSRDSRSLLVVTKPVSDDLGAPNHLWLIAGYKAPREIRGTAENVQTVSWLPDGRVAYFARCTRDAPIVCRDLFVQALDGSKPRNLTDGIDGSLITGIENAATSGPVVTLGGDILVTIARHFDEQVARVDATDGHLTWIDALPAVVKVVSTNASQNGFALLAAERGGVTTVELADPRLASYVPIGTPTLQPSDWAGLHGRRIMWTSDKRTIDGLLYLPAGVSAGKRVPLVIDVHGGPAGRFEDSDYPLVRLLLAQGWAVLHVNPRGSFGYGIDFLASLKDDLGGGDYQDIMAGIDTALAQAPIDRDRMALIGYSYGAAMTTVVLGRTNRFKGFIAAAPVVDQISEYGTEGSSWYDRWYFGQPWRQLDRAWRQSSLSLVTKARTPLLLLHGESDPINPVGQSFELYRALRQEGVPVELMLFPRETHLELGRNFYGFPSVEPYHGIALRQRMVDFLSDAFAGRPNAGLAGADKPQPR